MISRSVVDGGGGSIGTATRLTRGAPVIGSTRSTTEVGRSSVTRYVGSTSWRLGVVGARMSKHGSDWKVQLLLMG